MFSRINRAFVKSRAEDGFTLIELLIVIVIIGILAAIAIPVFLNQQNAAHDASVKSDARNTVIGVATALVTKPDATGFSVLAPGDTTAAVKLAGVPTVIVTVPTGVIAVRGVATQSNWVTVRGTGADYVVHAQSTVDGFWYEFSSKTGKYTSSSDTPTVTPAVPSSKTPVPNSVQNPNGIAMRVDGAPVTTTTDPGAGAGTGAGGASGGGASGKIYGVDTLSLPVQNGYGALSSGFTARGGYVQDPYFALPVNYWVVPEEHDSIGALRLSDPVRLLTGDYPSSVLGVYIESTALSCSLSYCDGASGQVGAVAAPSPTTLMNIVCAPTQWSLPSEQHTVSSIGSAKVRQSAGGSQVVQGAYLTFGNGASTATDQCPFLVSMNFYVDTMTVQTQGTYNATDHTVYTVNWTARQPADTRVYSIYNAVNLACTSPLINPSRSPDCS